jgi:uncharacterized protein YjiS (DUF1127 family)
MSQKWAISDFILYHYVGRDSNLSLLEAVMHTATIRSARSFESFNARTLSRWRYRLRSVLSTGWHRNNDESKHGSLNRLDDRLLADIGLYREHRIHNPENRRHQQREAPVPVFLLAMWMPRL